MQLLEAEEIDATSARGRNWCRVKALIGWMDRHDALVMLSGQRGEWRDRREHAERVEAAKMAVARRPQCIDHSDSLGDCPGMLSRHIEMLKRQPTTATYFKEGWQVVMVDLAKVCAIQPHLCADQATDRVGDMDPRDFETLASISIPIEEPLPMSMSFDKAKQAWILSSPNMNLRIVGHYNFQVRPGVTGIGFAVETVSSFMQVISYQGRYLLRDGYHRAYAFLRRGIRRVPVFFREFPTLRDVAQLNKMLPQEAFLGDRPPLLRDYFDDEVCADVELEAAKKVIIIQGMELNVNC